MTPSQTAEHTHRIIHFCSDAEQVGIQEGTCADPNCALAAKDGEIERLRFALRYLRDLHDEAAADESELSVDEWEQAWHDCWEQARRALEGGAKRVV